jgi:hypothetical protein
MKYECHGGPLDGQEIDIGVKFYLYIKSNKKGYIHAYAVRVINKHKSALCWCGLIPRKYTDGNIKNITYSSE